MKPAIRWLCGILCAFVLMGFSPTVTAQATSSVPPESTPPANEEQAGYSAPGQDSDIDFYIKANLPDNQLTNVPFFDLRLQPGQTQTLEVLVGNESTDTLRVKVRAVCASTSRRGIIDYKNDAQHDETLPFRFCEAAYAQQEIVEIPGGQTAIARVDVQMPQQAYNGSVLGSVLVEKIPQEEWESTSNSVSSTEDSTDGLQLQNRYYYAIAVRLWQGNNIPQLNFQLNNVTAEKVDGRPAIVYAIQNPVANVAVGMEGDFIVYRAGIEKPVAVKLAAPLEMANNSAMNYSVTPTSGRLPDGHYTSVVQLRHNGKTWNYTAEFDITGEQAHSINVLEQPEPERYIPQWLIVALVVLALLAAMFAAAFFFIYKNRASQKRKPRIRHNSEPPPGGYR